MAHKERALEFEEPLDSIEDKVHQLAHLIKKSKHTIIYTGAGISTSASIPDYRGPNGLWTQIRKVGTFSITKLFDLGNVEPTYTHMAIRELCKKRIVKHVVSQNCDGLHLRSGIPQTQLSEIHGNMYIEVCPSCERQYFRQADITERTSRFRHKTGRKCHQCAEPNNNNLIDTIVLYGERSRTKWPMNWDRASKAAQKADLIICLGSSLKTLRRYGCLWPKTIGSSKTKNEQDTKLVIINLQYTPKDKNSVLKIHGKCDIVMQLLMQKLDIEVPAYTWTKDPLLNLAVPFTKEERANLNRNLIFETLRDKQAAQNNNSHDGDHKTSDEPLASSTLRPTPDTEARVSPSVFISELTDDPDKKRLKMTIRTVNVGASGSGDQADNEQVPEQQQQHRDGDNENNLCKNQDESNENHIKQEALEGQVLASKKTDMRHHLPGWLGKSIGVKSSTYRRKRHGNKGRKHWTALRSQSPKISSVPPPPPSQPAEPPSCAIVSSTPQQQQQVEIVSETS